MNKELVALKDAGVFTEEDISEELIGVAGSQRIYHLYRKGLINETRFEQYYRDKFNYPNRSGKEIFSEEALMNLLPEGLMRDYFVLPLSSTETELELLMADPLDYEAREMVESLSGLTVSPVIGNFKEIERFFDSHFSVENSIKNIVKTLESKDLSAISLSGMGKQIFESTAHAGPVSKMLHLIISQAIQEGASDIHFEPTDNFFQVRFRVDGVLHKVMDLPEMTISSLVTSIKILAKLDIAEKRVPLDGGFQARVQDKVFDIRVSTFPVTVGEKVAMRLLDKKELNFSMSELGMSKMVISQFERMIRQNYGIILVTGPTGSGKTTTLYTALNEIKSIEKNIVTIEDPVEYHLDMINQSQANPKAGLTFAKGLRSVLRQDPDIILLGEVRDKETAEISFQAAMTGHLVFTTLHTNDAASAITRLIDMGVPSYLVCSSIIGVLSQRLVRKSCPHCQVPYELSGPTKDWIAEEVENSWYLKEKIDRLGGLASIKTKIATGCEFCKGTKYSGRVGVFELLPFSEEVRKLSQQPDVTSGQVKSLAREQGMLTFVEDGIDKVLAGTTTFEEVSRVFR